MKCWNGAGSLSIIFLALVFSACGPKPGSTYKVVRNVPTGDYRDAVEVETVAGDKLRGERIFENDKEIVLRVFGEEATITFPKVKVASVVTLTAYSEIYLPEPEYEYEEPGPPSRLRLLPSVLLPGSGQLWYRGASDLESN